MALRFDRRFGLVGTMRISGREDPSDPGSLRSLEYGIAPDIRLVGLGAESTTSQVKGFPTRSHRQIASLDSPIAPADDCELRRLTTQPALVSRFAPSSGIRFARAARSAHPHWARRRILEYSDSLISAGPTSQAGKR